MIAIKDTLLALVSSRPPAAADKDWRRFVATAITLVLPAAFPPADRRAL